MSEELTVFQKLAIKTIITLGFAPLTLVLTFSVYELVSDTASDFQMIDSIKESAETVDYIPEFDEKAIEDYFSTLVPSLDDSGDAIIDDSKKNLTF